MLDLLQKTLSYPKNTWKIAKIDFPDLTVRSARALSRNSESAKSWYLGYSATCRKRFARDARRFAHVEVAVGVLGVFRQNDSTTPHEIAPKYHRFRVGKHCDSKSSTFAPYCR